MWKYFPFNPGMMPDGIPPVDPRDRPLHTAVSLIAIAVLVGGYFASR